MCDFYFFVYVNFSMIFFKTICWAFHEISVWFFAKVSNNLIFSPWIFKKKSPKRRSKTSYFLWTKRWNWIVLFMIYNHLSEYLLKHLAQVQTLMMMSASSEDAGFRSITRKFQIYSFPFDVQFERVLCKQKKIGDLCQCCC